MLPMSPEDGLDEYRQAMNDVLLQQAQGNLGMQKQIFLTVADQRKNYTEAAAFFTRLEGTLQNGAKQLRSEIMAVVLCSETAFVFCTIVYRPGVRAHVSVLT